MVVVVAWWILCIRVALAVEGGGVRAELAGYYLLFVVPPPAAAGLTFFLKTGWRCEYGAGSAQHCNTRASMCARHAHTHKRWNAGGGSMPTGCR